MEQIADDLWSQLDPDPWPYHPAAVVPLEGEPDGSGNAIKAGNVVRTRDIAISPHAGKPVPKELLVDVAKSFKNQTHLDAIVREAEAMVNRALER